ncbi:MAG: molybdopterin dehydrogenase [Rhodospirillaceae bacterium]|nr:molybdopterin dehydrogenase [Rhodospirillaceae bacterium]|tara:strand:+ start:15847 stop:16728 length:882 start_codon:yes stop_codon:yes gene_type:complete
MKAAPFDYVRVSSIDEVCQVLADSGEEARIIAGGQTLVPLMAMRLARPSLLIDINDVSELSGISVDGNDLVIKAGTRQADALASDIVKSNVPLLADALSHVGHTQTRNRGTVGGSLVNADPSAEIPLIAQTLDAVIVARSTRGDRTIPVNEFLESAMATTLAPDECLVEAHFPIWASKNTGFGFHEVSIRDSDFALAAAAAQVTLNRKGNCEKLNVAIGGASPAALRLTIVEEELVGTDLGDDAIKAACAKIGDLIDPQADVHADAAYRGRVAKVMAGRAICDSRDRAKGVLQ